MLPMCCKLWEQTGRYKSNISEWDKGSGFLIRLCREE